jgi:iron complex transport system ATP-binding protein
MITVEELHISYDGLQNILSHITFGVKKGTFIGVIGPNGSGKTTLLNALSRILTPSDGVIFVQGRELSSLSQRELARELGVVPQDTNIHFDFRVRDIVLMGRHPYIDRFSRESEEDYEIARRAMEMTRTIQFADRSILEISGGERQRVIIARALAQQPRVLLLDEPTSHLDISHQMEILGIIKGLKHEVTVVAVFHDLNLASYYCDELILLDKGEIRYMGTPGEVLTREHIREIFRLEAIVKTNPLTRKPYVMPIFEERREDPEGRTIHIICGGGSGSDLMRLLHGRGYRLTTGVLCINDSDYETARDLHISCICEPPFATITPASLALLEEYLARADLVILTEMPVGPGNMENIRILERIEGTPIIHLAGREDPAALQDFSGGEATTLLERLYGSMVHAHSVAELLERIEETLGGPDE